MSERALAKVVLVDDIRVHENADSLELAIIGGWQCVVRKGEFKKGQKALYCEIDSMLPIDEPDFAFLADRKDGLKEVGGKMYSRIKTIKLRKELSQGLLIPVPSIVEKAKVGDDVTKKLKVIKYEKPEAGVSGPGIPAKPKGFLDKLIRLIVGRSESAMKPWPSFIQKTDQERVQNRTVSYLEAVEKSEKFEITYKLDGSSWTAFQYNGKTGVCSRNWELQSADVEWTKLQQIRHFIGDVLQRNRRILKNRKFVMPEFKTGIKVTEDNFVKMFRKYDLDHVLKEQNMNIALQGEMVGPGIQANFEGNKELEVYIYNVYDIDKQTYMLPQEAKALVESIGMKYVPIFANDVTLPLTVQDCLTQAEGPSAFKTGKFREGLVYKSLTRDYSFKAISNSYLLKTDG